eukprot:scaffold214208_cov21-Tisochrysis_lutea.AAC.1
MGTAAMQCASVASMRNGRCGNAACFRLLECMKPLAGVYPGQAQPGITFNLYPICTLIIASGQRLPACVSLLAASVPCA